MSNNGYMKASFLAPEAVLSWQDIGAAMELALFSVRIGRRPTWVPVRENLGVGGYVYVLFVPSRSAMARVWTVGMRVGKERMEEGGGGARAGGSWE